MKDFLCSVLDLTFKFVEVHKITIVIQVTAVVFNLWIITHGNHALKIC